MTFRIKANAKEYLYHMSFLSHTSDANRALMRISFCSRKFTWIIIISGNTLTLQYKDVLGHGFTLHECASVLFPKHARPPCNGAGFVHDRDLDFCPLPQLTEHEDQPDQTFHLPSTV